MVDGVRVVLVSGPEAPAPEICRTLLAEGLIACGSMVSGVRSIYRWEGRVEDEEESLLVLKTVESKVPDLVSRIVELHPYEVPEVLVFEVAAGHGPYLEWVARETGSAE